MVPRVFDILRLGSVLVLRPVVTCTHTALAAPSPAKTPYSEKSSSIKGECLDSMGLHHATHIPCSQENNMVNRPFMSLISTCRGIYQGGETRGGYHYCSVSFPNKDARPTC